MSECKQFEERVYVKQKEAKSSDKRFSHEEVFNDLRARLVEIANRNLKNELY
ncbi:hypothetical protein KFZ58_04730 [Virgibacillus sp. NKC19-16]|uniref:hypothetical protein n=1 Tax=Virgibacillus salidurans TaxID=2831673 RepID=UPI001F3FA920|nr:hypothetical protein [Virgibacillus sp. NKC19-16]UJL47222.1 hypothetical protein KFZ58_04730 [Virgibacillus sp. NKC19-16]